MNCAYVNISLWSEDGSLEKTVRVKVDTKKTYSQFPAGLLRELGWPIIDANRPCIMPDGSPAIMKMGQAKVGLDGVAGHSMVIFGPDDCLPTLGSHTLDSLGLEINPEDLSLTAKILHRPTRTIISNDPR